MKLNTTSTAHPVLLRPRQRDGVRRVPLTHGKRAGRVAEEMLAGFVLDRMREECAHPRLVGRELRLGVMS